MSNPWVVFAAVGVSIAFLIVTLMFGAALMTAFYPDDLNDHKDD